MTKNSSPTSRRLSSPDSFPRFTDLGYGCPQVLRLGLATRGNTHLPAASVRYAVDRGVNYLNWCGYDDGIRQAVGEIDRTRIVLATQLYAHRGPKILRELEKALKDLKTDWLDVVTFYYMESETEWAEISGPGGALEALRGAQQQGKVRSIGLTTHQRALGARVAETGAVDLLMIRYNAAHRGAEQDVFPPDPADEASCRLLHGASLGRPAETYPRMILQDLSFLLRRSGTVSLWRIRLRMSSWRPRTIPRNWSRTWDCSMTGGRPGRGSSSRWPLTVSGCGNTPARSGRDGKRARCRACPPPGLSRRDNSAVKAGTRPGVSDRGVARASLGQFSGRIGGGLGAVGDP